MKLSKCIELHGKGLNEDTRALLTDIETVKNIEAILAKEVEKIRNVILKHPDAKDMVGKAPEKLRQEPKPEEIVQPPASQEAEKPAEPEKETKPRKPRKPAEPSVEDKRKLKAVKRLRSTGERLKERAEEKYNQDRNTNTARRARIAASVEADASHDIAIAKTMLKIADGIESGELKYLSGIGAKTHVDLLDRMFQQVKYKFLSDNGLNYETHKYDPPTEGYLKYIKYPSITIRSEMAPSLQRDLEGYRGGKKLAKQVRPGIMGDATAKEVITFAKAHRISLMWTLEDDYMNRSRLKKIGINNTKELHLALKELLNVRSGRIKEDPIKVAERALIGVKGVGIDFFPTPKTVINKMMDEADIQEGMNVLEPSAGKGDIADVIKEKTGITPDVVEISAQLQDLLTLKGYDVQMKNFLELSPDKKYDRIIMNPPFSKNQDIKHVKHAYKMLKPDGRIVAIISEHSFFANDKDSKEFREWASDKGWDEKLDQAFKGKEAFVQTGVVSRMVVIDKPSEEGEPMFSLKDRIITEEEYKNPALLVEKRIEDKYSDILSLDVPAMGEPYNKTSLGEISPKELKSHLMKTKNKDLAKEKDKIKSAIADNIGNLIETYKYESYEEGRDIERYLDSLLKVLGTVKKTVPEVREQLDMFTKKETEKDMFGEEKKVVKEKKVEPKAVFGQKMTQKGKKKPEVPTAKQLDMFGEDKKQIQTTMFDVKDVQPVWYSQMENVLSQKLPGKGTPESMLQSINAFAKKGEFKADELSWSGIEEWLSEQTGKVTKQQVLDYLKENNVQIKEVVKGGGRISESDIDTFLADEAGEGYTREEAREYLLNDEETAGYVDYLTAENGDFDEGYYVVSDYDTDGPYDTEDEAFAELSATRKLLRDSEPKFSQYTEPGGENYKEVLLTLPPYKFDKKTQARIDELNKKVNEYKATKEEQIELNRLLEKRSGDEYTGGHWEEPNVLAHLRLNERTDSEGERVLFLEEIQSDYGAAYRNQLKNIEKSVTNNFKQIVKAMEKANVLEEVC